MQIAETAEERRRTVGEEKVKGEEEHGEARINKEKAGTSWQQQGHTDDSWKARGKGLVISLTVILLSYHILAVTSPRPSQFSVITNVPPAHCGLKLSSTLQNLILDKHNEIRSKVALGEYAVDEDTLPSAANMAKLMWDCELELDAQNKAAECEFDEKSEKNRKMDGLDKVKGENAFYFRSGDEFGNSQGVLKGIERMGDEIAVAGIKEVLLGRFDKRIGHATQIIWGTTRRVGCAVQECAARQDGSLDGQKYNVAVCKYYPTGNVFKSNGPTAIYTPGMPGASCSEGTLVDPTSGLCVEARKKEEEN